MVPDSFESLSRVLATQLDVFPEHRDYLERRFADADLATLKFSDELARMIETICGSHLRTVCEDYRWLSGVILDEELFFRRNGKYRLSSFAEALETIYANRPYMTRYVNGILASQLWWANHTDTMRYFRDVFIAGAPADFSHLEVGPGHGLFLSLAASSPKCRSVEGWDVSDASLAGTKETLEKMGFDSSRIVLRKVDIRDAPAAAFDSITFSEVLEHLEEPLSALQSLHRLLKPGGRIFVNAPVNSPAPDHIFLFRTPEEVVEMVTAAGFTVVETLFAPITGATLDRARRHNLTISAVVIATK
jgi:2-polyprenyl-3-methyl-5-hydroxy-6-metoxy-1,4-benzoquinol methylase